MCSDAQKAEEVVRWGGCGATIPVCARSLLIPHTMSSRSESLH